MNKRLIRSIIPIILVIAADQASKIIAKNELKGEGSISQFNDIWRWVYAENTGAFLSWGSDLDGIGHLLLMKVIPVVLLVGLFIYTIWSEEVILKQVIPLSLIIGGGMSNLYDRMMYGRVIDFMNIGIGDLRTGIFNIADMAIMTGIIWLLISSFSEKKQSKQEDKAIKESTPLEE